MIKKKSNKFLSIVSGTLLLTTALPLIANNQDIASHLYLAAGLQLNDLSIKHVNSIDTPGLLPQEFHTATGKTISTGIALSFGYIWHLKPNWSIHSGVGVYINNNQKVTGKYYATPYTPGYDNPYLSYYYNLSSNQYMLESNVWYHFQHRWAAFAGAGVGLSHIDTGALTIDETGAVLPPNTQSVHNNYFAASVDTGLAYYVTPDTNINIRLKKSWLGASYMSVDNGTNQMTNAKINNVNPWQVQVSISFKL